MESKNKKERLDYFDIAKGIAIILVVLGHLINPKNPISIWLYSFHIPLFFIIAGALIKYKREIENKIKVIIPKKMWSLFIPYISFSILYIIYETFNLVIMNIGTLTNLKSDIYVTMCLRGIGTLWFLPALFFGEILFLIIMKRISKAYIKLGIIGLLFALSVLIGNFLGYQNENHIISNYLYIPILTIFRSFISLFFIAIGYYIYSFILSKNIKGYYNLLIGVFLLIANVIISQYNAPVDLNFIIIGNVSIYIICGIIGSLSIIFICKALKHNKLLTFYGINSLVIFATHFEFPFREKTNIIIKYINENLVNLSNYHLEVITKLAIIFTLELIPIIILNKFFPLILGKRNIKKMNLNK